MAGIMDIRQCWQSCFCRWPNPFRKLRPSFNPENNARNPTRRGVMKLTIIIIITDFTNRTRVFFCIVAAWYFLTVALIFLSAHALACALERRCLKTPPPEGQVERRRWWLLRLLPLLVCASSLGTELSRGQMDVLMLTAIALGLYLATK